LWVHDRCLTDIQIFDPHAHSISTYLERSVTSASWAEEVSSIEDKGMRERAIQTHQNGDILNAFSRVQEMSSVLPSGRPLLKLTDRIEQSEEVG
jgi:hypothetical protein